MTAALRLLLLTASVHTCTKSRSAEWVSCKSTTIFLCCCCELCLTFISSYYSHWMLETMKQRNKETKRRRRAVCGFKMCHANEAVHPGSCSGSTVYTCYCLRRGRERDREREREKEGNTYSSSLRLFSPFFWKINGPDDRQTDRQVS